MDGINSKELRNVRKLTFIKLEQTDEERKTAHRTKIKGRMKDAHPGQFSSESPMAADCELVTRQRMKARMTKKKKKNL